MITIDLKFPAYDEILHIRNGDLQTLKYENKKRYEESVYDTGKRDHCEKRNGHWHAARPRQIRELEAKLREKSIILCEWTSDTNVTLIFSSGAIAYLTVNHNTLDILQVLFDRYCIGKLSTQNVSSVVFSNSHILFVCAEQNTVLISYGTIPPASSVPCRIANKDPHVQIIQLAGPARRSERQVSWSKDAKGLHVLIWSSASSDPVPWSPVGEDRANLHLYHINGSHMKLMNYLQLENETLCALISRIQSNIVHIVEQISVQKAGVYLEWTSYETSSSAEGISKLSAVGETSQANLPAPARIVRHSPNEINLLVACIDGSVHVVHQTAGLTHSAHAGFIATDVRWAGDIAVVSEERGRLQCYDRALALLHHHEKCLDLTQYFKEPRRMSLTSAHGLTSGALLLLSFTGGPLALLRITHPKLPNGYINAGRYGRAVAFLRSLDWATEGERCLAALQDVVRGALRRGLRSDNEAAIQAALGAYFQNKANSSPAAQRFASSVHDLARKFFHHLLRRGRLDKALSLAVELGACDLFVDARWAATRAGLQDLADEAHSLATAANAATTNSQSTPSHGSTCSESCSQCSLHSSRSASDDEMSDSNELSQPPPLPRVPPLPNCSTIMPVPIVTNEPISTNSIRPLHQYLDRDRTIWNTEVSNDPSLKTITQTKNNPPQHKTWLNIDSSLLKNKQSFDNKQLSVSNYPTRLKSQNQMGYIPNPINERLDSRFGRAYKTQIQNETAITTYTNMYRYRDDATTSYDRTACERFPNDVKSNTKYPEKNKVKFSNTVTIAVVPESRSVTEQPERAESLPRAHLSTWSTTAVSTPTSTGTMLDYVEV